VLIALVPPSIYNLCKRWVVAEAFELLVGYARLFALLLGRLVEGVVGSRVCFGVGVCCARTGFGGLRRVVEDGAIEARDSVEQEVVDIVVLQPC
jgi:hypothetical protein